VTPHRDAGLVDEPGWAGTGDVRASCPAAGGRRPPEQYVRQFGPPRHDGAGTGLGQYLRAGSADRSGTTTTLPIVEHR